jgi:DNA-binding transcriptional regulator GbsR (MarR family)
MKAKMMDDGANQSQLFNSKEPMTLFELREWLGHSRPAATQRYAKLTPIKLAKSYADAGLLRAKPTRK